MKTEINFNPKNLMIVVVGLIVLGFVAWVALDNGAMKIWSFFVDLCIFMVQALMITACALSLQWCSQVVRSNAIFDINGAGIEMKKVQDRMGQDNEKENDGIACSIKYTGWTLFSAIVLLAFFLMHTP